MESKGSSEISQLTNYFSDIEEWEKEGSAHEAKEAEDWESANFVPFSRSAF